MTPAEHDDYVRQCIEDRRRDRSRGPALALLTALVVIAALIVFGAW